MVEITVFFLLITLHSFLEAKEYFKKAQQLHEFIHLLTKLNIIISHINHKFITCFYFYFHIFIMMTLTTLYIQ